jgi:tRNA threonylcarbamoyladenosine biosynthesis protein TsaE
VEWPQKGKGLLPDADIEIKIRYENDGRHFILEAFSERADAILGSVSEQLRSRMDTVDE